MVGKWKTCVVGAILGLSAGVYCLSAADAPPEREALMKKFKEGNYKDAYEGLRKLALDPKDDASLVMQDMNTGVQALQNLGRVDEIDEFREGVIKAHKDNWRLLEVAATSYTQVQHYGFVVAGQYYRGHKRGGGKWVSSLPRDRVRALQLMQQALPLVKNEQDKAAAAQFHLNFANMLLTGGGYHEPWRLQYLSDLTQLPDYEEGQHYYGGNNRGAPVDENGNPVYHKLPESWDKAQTDGERWRWNLEQCAKLAPGRLNEVEVIFADFQRSQFGVQTMAAFGYGFGAQDDKKDNKTGTFQLHTLNDDETIARLASGVKRFKVPDEFNWILIYNRVAARGKSHYGEKSRDALSQIYEDRRQYPKAALAWKKAIEEYGPGINNFRNQRLDQIVGNWGRFEAGQSQAAGKGGIVDFRFRNGTKVSFEAHEIKVPKLLDDVKAYLKSNPGKLDWNQANIGDIGYRLVELAQAQYLGAKVANWDLDLTPRPNHVDDRVTVTTPLQKAGAYLLTAQMANGNVSRIIVWLNDSIIVKKQLDGKVYYYVADAVSGKPVADANVELFGWRQVQVEPNRNLYRVDTLTTKESTDKDGQLLIGNDKQPQNYQWLVTATKKIQGGESFAYLGFTGVWYNNRYDPEYNATKIFTITDRPVYRPAQSVKFKFWVRHAKYDEQDNSSFAGQPFTVQINNPRGEKVFERAFTADEYGGFDGEFPLSKDVMLGQYYIHIPNQGGNSFRIEEYKKPEFEVKVEAPKEPVRLGEKIEATIQAKYYFGAPVVKAKVKYKVTRSSYSTGWYPTGSWDWFYGRGYWWFAADYPWYPGWGEWCGCKRPMPWWWGGNRTPPEIVSENEVEIGADGIVKVSIDTLPAKELHGDSDQQYTVTAEVTDESRRTIVGSGNVLVSRKPFQIFSWTHRGHYRAGETILARFKAQTLDQKPVEGKGELTLFKVTYNDKSEPVEEAVENWKLDTNEEGEARQQLKAAEPGQYRLSYKLTDSKKHTIEGAYVFTVRGQGFDGADFRFNDIELITDKREYKPGEKVKLLVNTNRAGAAVLLFVRPTNGIYQAPQVLHLKGKSTMEQIEIGLKDMPNMFVEALTIHDGKVHSEIREIVVPPEKRIINVEVLANKQEYLPGEKATMKVKLTDLLGKPFIGSTVLTMYDKSVEYISGGSNVPEIKEFFWKWRRHHQPRTESSLQHWFNNIYKRGELTMNNLGVFGEQVVEEWASKGPGQGRGVAKREALESQLGGYGGRSGGLRKAMNAAPGAPQAASLAADGQNRLEEKSKDAKESDKADRRDGGDPGKPAAGDVQPSIRKNFADTAFWAASLMTDKNGIAEISLTMPENLTAWKVKSWAMGHGTKVGQAEAEVTTKKNLLVRLQAPRFFTQKDEVVLSANVHNYLKTEKEVKVSLELDGNALAGQGSLTQKVTIPANGEKRVDWLVKVTNEGEAVVRMKALTDEESDAMEMRFPCYVHGMLKMESFAGVMRPDDKAPGIVVLSVPAERRINETRLEVRYSPTLAGALVDALPYLVEYPYGCTEQTLNRFLPTIITQRILQKMNVNLKDIQQKRTNLNAQEIGDDQKRAQGWKRYERNPVFDEEEVKKMANEGIRALTSMQLGDGGWGWFSGWGEHSWPHTTAVVVHGLQIAKENDLQLAAGMLERGVAWLQNYQASQVQMIKNAPTKTFPWKEHADNLDAMVFMVLVDAGQMNADMNDFLYRDRTFLAVQAKAMYGLALQKMQQADKLGMILKNIEQFVVQDDENQTAYLKLPADNPWWTWYGSEIEADGYYLKLLAKTDPKGKTASRLVKYLLNNRKHSTYWNSTRDTATCIEAMADYLKASGEDKPNMTLEVWMDGKRHKEVKIDATNLFTFDNKLVLLGDAVDTGRHTVEIRRIGTGPVYFNAYLTNFTLEDHITKAGLEIKVNRKYYKLIPVDKKIKVSGARGQALDQKVEKYQRTELSNMAQLKSGELVEVELEIDSKNDYEYLCFEDPKAAGFEPMLVRSGYNPNDMNAYMELRDEKVCFFCRTLARGKHSVSYRLRAEIPGKFSALPTRGYAMYAPELKGNSDEIKLRIAD